MLVDRILDAQADPAALEPARLDRLVIQQARLMSPGPRKPAEGHLTIPDPGARRALEAALSMEHQPLEAWVLARVDEVDDLWLGRAMDCSKTAARNHLNAADELMKGKLGPDSAAGISALKRFADELDAGPIIAREREARRKRAVRRGVGMGVAAGILVLGALLLLFKRGVL